MTVAATRSAATINAGSVPASSSERWRVEEDAISYSCLPRHTGEVARRAGGGKPQSKLWGRMRSYKLFVAFPLRPLRGHLSRKTGEVGKVAKHTLGQTRTHLGDHRLDRYALGAGGEVHRHAVAQDRAAQRHDVVDRRRQAPLDDGAGAAGQHEGLAGARAGAPGDPLFHDIEVARFRAAGAHQFHDRI